jgi:glycosyltransferase involved in cell wall biosynthesis
MKGDPRVLLLWERGDAKFELIKKLFSPRDLKKIILFRHPEENISYKEISGADMASYHVTIINTPFLPKEDFLAMMKEVGTVVAPRKKEGIGMSFLEPMAMGKCVIAHDDATMNQYIQNGVNGLLINFDNPKRLDMNSICHIHGQMTNLVKYRQQWVMDQEKIIDFIKNSKVTSLTLLEKLFYWVSFIPYLAEWVVFRIKGVLLP